MRLSIPVFAVLVLFVLLVPPPARADDKVERALFETVDEVELHGTFYPSSKGAEAPVALLLHNPGFEKNEIHNRDVWDGLAKALQKKGYAVLTFDFRGHGSSTVVHEAFWNVDKNKTLIKGASPKKTTISVKDFFPGYFPQLVNDITAARKFLDEKTNAKECNAANLVLIGAQEGATLGSLWLAAEWNRKPQRVPGGTNPPPFGEEVTAAVWLSYAPTIGHMAAKAGKWMGNLRGDDKTPMAILYGEDDKLASAVAKDLCESILKVNTPPRPKFQASLGVASKSAGADLLKVSTTEDKIFNFLEKAMEKRGAVAWMERDLKRQKFDFVDLKRYLQ